jgi:hypothetical protein
MSNIEKAQHDILQVPIDQTMIDWAREHSLISADRCISSSITEFNLGIKAYSKEEIQKQFEVTILFALRVGILLGREMHNDEV